MNSNKTIVIVGILFAILIAFIFIQFNPLGKTVPTIATPKIATVTIKDQTFKASVARTEEEKQKGLSGLKSIPLDGGMLFFFDKAALHNFWMKDMKFPIDIIFIKGDTIVSLSENVPAPKSANENLPLYEPSAPSDRVLEINAGLSKKYNIKKGDKIEINQ